MNYKILIKSIWDTILCFLFIIAISVVLYTAIYFIPNQIWYMSIAVIIVVFVIGSTIWDNYNKRLKKEKENRNEE